MVRRVIRPWPTSVRLSAIGVWPGQRVQDIEQRPPVLLDREHELPATFMDEFGGGLDRVQRVRGDRAPGDVQGCQQIPGTGRLVGLGPGHLGLTDHHRNRAGLGATGQRGQQLHLAAVGIDGPAQGLAVQAQQVRRLRHLIVDVLRAGSRSANRRPRSDRGIQGMCIGVRAHPPQRRA
jgi:hypothetical protein